MNKSGCGIPTMRAIARHTTLADGLIFSFKDTFAHRHAEYRLWLLADKTKKYRIITDENIVTLRYDDTGEKFSIYLDETQEQNNENV